MNKNHLHLLDRIKNLNVSIIENMSYDAMAMMTDRFNESLVRNVLYQGKTNREQRKIIKRIKENYKCWKKDTEMLWGSLPQLEVYPPFLLEMQMDIECGMVVTAEGSFSEPQLTPSVMPPVLGESLRKLKGLSETVAEDNTQKIRAIIEKKEKRIKELETSVNSTTIGKTTVDVDNEKINQLITEKDNTINELQQKISDYASRFDPKDVKGKKVFAMTGKQHAILLLAVLAHHNRIPNARTNLSYLLSFIASRNESTMKDYLKERITPKECEELAKYFDDVVPFIGNLIRALPDKLEKDKSEKNRAKVLKNK